MRTTKQILRLGIAKNVLPMFFLFNFGFLFFLCRLGSELLDWSMLRSEMQFTNLSYCSLDCEATSLNHLTHCHFGWILRTESFKLKHANTLTIMFCYVFLVCIVCDEGDCNAPRITPRIVLLRLVCNAFCSKTLWTGWFRYSHRHSLHITKHNS